MKYPAGRFLRSAIPFVLASLLFRLPAEAATNTVLNLNDGLIAGTLRFMIANSAPGDTIVFDSGLAGTLVLSGELVINKNLTLLGPGPKVITVSGNNASRVFYVTNASASIAALTIAHGRLVGADGAVSGAPGESVYGAGIFNAGTLTIRDCNLLQNYAQAGAGINSTSSGAGGGALGGAICNNGTLTLERCTLTENVARGGNGGGGFLSSPAGGAVGGGVYNAGVITLRNCTVVANSVTGGNGGNGAFNGGSGGIAQGGAVYNAAQLIVAACTISANTNTGGLGGSGSTAGAPGIASGGGIRAASGSSLIRNTIVAGNIALSGPDVTGDFTSQGFNLIGNGAGSTGLGVTCDLVGTTGSPVNPMLSPLYDYGGATPTMLPLPGSLAIDQGDGGGITTDQRGLPRSIDGPIPNSFCNSSNASDIGAVEVQPSAIYEWTFDDGDLSAMLGPGLMTYADAATPGLTGFGTTDGATVPHMGGFTATYMRVPAFTGLTNGYRVSLTATYPNGGGYYLNQYTFIADVLLPIAVGFMPFFNTNPDNQNDADFYVAPNGSVGIQVYSSPGIIASNTWYRVALVGNLTSSSLTFYVNGIPVRTNNSAPLDGRWALFSEADPGADLLLFNEGDLSGVYTHEVLVAGVALVDRSLNASEIANLGGPAAEGIFVRRLRINRNGSSVALTWRAAPHVSLETTSSLPTSNWQSVPGTLGAGDFTIAAAGGAFYRLNSN